MTPWLRYQEWNGRDDRMSLLEAECSLIRFMRENGLDYDEIGARMGKTAQACRTALGNLKVGQDALARWEVRQDAAFGADLERLAWFYRLEGLRAVRKLRTVRCA